MATLTASSRRTRRWGAGTAAIARLLIAADLPLSGVAIAAEVGVTQPRASQVLRQLRENGGVRPTAHGYIGRRARLLDLYLRHARPPLLEPETYWYSARSMAEQARSLLAVSRERGIRMAFSADLGPDLLVPWRHPTVTVLYTDQPLDPESARFVAAEGRADASLIIRHTNDATLLSASAGWPDEVEGLPLADPVQQWFDLLDLGGNDRQEAAARLRQAVLHREAGLQRA